MLDIAPNPSIVTTLESLLSTVTLVVVGLASWLLPKYLERRVGEAARGAVDLSVGKSLAEHRLTIDTRLEEYRSGLMREMESLRQTLALDRERYSRDYGLFATRRNEVYAETFGLLERARGAFAERFAPVTSRRVFHRSPEADLRGLGTRLELINEGERQHFLDLLDQGRLDEARKQASILVERESLRQANRAFYDFRNACVLHALYFSPSVDSILSHAVQELGLLSVYADELLDEGETVPPRVLAEQFRKVEAITTSLKRALREDMQGSFATQAQGACAADP